MDERTIRHPWRHAAACGLLVAVDLPALAVPAALVERLRVAWRARR